MTHRLIALALLCGLSGCHLIKVNTNANMRSNIMGEKTSFQFKFKGTLDELPAALSKAYDELAKTAEQIIAAIKKAAAAPPPGKVRLRNLARSLKKFENKQGVDFLVAEAPDRFQYVRIGARSYDDFFRTSMEFYALAWQTAQTAHRIRQLASAVLEEEVDAEAELSATLTRALGVPTTPTNKILKDKLSTLQESTKVIADLVPAFVEKSQALVQTGQALIAGAASSITNPKVLLHLDLIKEGIEQSITVLAESAELLVDATKSLANF